MDLKNIIISHINSNGDLQSNDDHQLGVATLASQFANDFGMSEWGKVIGLLHDKGKEKTAFQQHIMKESGYDPNIKVEGDYSHAYVGALIAKKLFSQPPYYQLIDNIIMGHHRGLYDYGEKQENLKKEIPKEVSDCNLDVDLKLPPCQSSKDLHHVIRMLYSCLVDADYLDTEKFMMPEQSNLRGGKSSIDELIDMFSAHMDKLKKNAPDTEVNKIRNEVQQYCMNASNGNVDFYSLTVPTGGGKTLASVLWALHHAKRNNLKRIIIAIPYTSIITQTAQVLRNIFGDENVLEHHSNIDPNEANKKLKLATENWDYPIIVTTNVQLLESLFSNRPSHCRKLHNIAKSVLILDEVQTLPLDFLQPIVDTFNTLKSLFGTSILFTTASQPILNGEIRGTIHTFKALPNINEIIPTEANLHQRLKRVELSFDTESSTHEDIADRMLKHDRVLCIVNTRKDAFEIYKHLSEKSEGITLHLSRMMCSAHIKETIETVKRHLSDPAKIVRVVATQLIEAGVDVDFPVVYRQEAGLDSILQAAGRCNREGKLGVSTTYVFKLNRPLPPGMMTKSNNARLNMGTNHDWFSPNAMTEYFKQLHCRTETFDKEQISSMLYGSQHQFEVASTKFRLIDDATIGVIVYWNDNSKLIDQLRNFGPSYRLMREISQYSVNIRKYDFDKLFNNNAIEEIYENIYVISSPYQYNERIGLTIENALLEETFIV